MGKRRIGFGAVAGIPIACHLVWLRASATSAGGVESVERIVETFLNTDKGQVMLAYFTFLVHLLEHEDALRREVVNYDGSGYIGGSVYEY